ncbi:MAG: YfbR-like 5'-deoxynucleotidase, partial [Candidatus Micrarchaeaceae archaeon]
MYPEMVDRVQFIVDGGATKRFHTVQTISQNTVAEHSFGTAMMVNLLMNGKASKDLLWAALIHDMAECETGDIPAPAKRLFGLRETMGDHELCILTRVGFDMPELNAVEKYVLKVADCLDGALFCAREHHFGNKNIDLPYKRFKSYIAEL